MTSIICKQNDYNTEGVFMKNTCSLILAAGTGTRMFTNKPKVLMEVVFKPMIHWVIDSVACAGIRDICTVCGYRHKELEDYFERNNINTEVIIQSEQKGTAHAVFMAKSYLEKNLEKEVLILAGDAPFINSETIKKSFKLHVKLGNDATVISAELNNPFGYGRIVRDKNTREIIAIVEQKDATAEVSGIHEVNSGLYWFKVKSLLDILPKINNYNNQNEFYLPDAIKLLIRNAKKVGSYSVDDETIILGANTKAQLNKLNEIAIKKRLDQLMAEGVDIPLKDGIIISTEVKFGRDVRVLPGSVIYGRTSIGSNCTIGPNVLIKNCFIRDNTDVQCGCYEDQTLG